jgi:hypothetical protein
VPASIPYPRLHPTTQGARPRAVTPFVSAAIIADAINGSTAPEIRIRTLLANSISTTLLTGGGDNAGVVASSGGAAAIVTAENEGALSGTLRAERHSSCRQRNTWLV